MRRVYKSKLTCHSPLSFTIISCHCKLSVSILAKIQFFPFVGDVCQGYWVALLSCVKLHDFSV
jgi:hypothetical protein